MKTKTLEQYRDENTGLKRQNAELARALTWAMERMQEMQGYDEDDLAAERQEYENRKEA